MNVGDSFTWRRLRRAFRYAVASAVVLTAALIVSERYLRYDLDETQYRMALTLEPDSARPILRNVVRHQESEKSRVDPRYLAALAAIEEEDKVLDTYQKAVAASPSNSFLLIQYGCRLFEAGLYREARDRFREAAVYPPANLLPRYLEIAALAAGLEESADLGEIFALMARANNMSAPLLFPEPSWHPTLPTRCLIYQRRQEAVVTRCLDPLYRLVTRIRQRAAQEWEQGKFADWSSRLDMLTAMGRRFASDAPQEIDSAMVQKTLFGLSLLRDAFEMQGALLRAENYTAAETLEERSRRLEQAINTLQSLVQQQEEVLAQKRRLFRMPFFIAAITMLFLGAAWLLAALFARGHAQNPSILPLVHDTKTIVFFVVYTVLLFSLLFLYSWLPQRPAVLEYAPTALVLTWAAAVFCAAGYGVYRAFYAFREDMSLVVKSEAVTDAHNPARRISSQRFWDYLRRYFGVLLGCLVIALCAYAVAFRAYGSVYPFQTDLILDVHVKVPAEVTRLIAELRAGN